MPNLHDIIEQIQKDLYCPVCGKNYKIGELRIKGFLDKTLIVQTICSSGHMTVFMTTLRKKDKSAELLKTNDILDLHNVLEKFDGNFEKLWKK